MKVLCIIVLYNQKLYDSLSYQTGISKFLNNNDISLFIYDNSQIPQHIKQDFDQFEGRIVYNSDSPSLCPNSCVDLCSVAAMSG